MDCSATKIRYKALKIILNHQSSCHYSFVLYNYGEHQITQVGGKKRISAEGNWVMECERNAVEAKKKMKPIELKKSDVFSATKTHVCVDLVPGLHF